MLLTLVIIVILLTSYLSFIAYKVGLHQRLSLALGPISLEQIPLRAANKYGDKPLFTCDKPCSWIIPSMHDENNDTMIWSAKSINRAVGMMATMLTKKLGLQPGDRVAILKQNHFDIHLFIMSVIRVGGIACPMNGKFDAKNINPYVANLESKIMISDFATIARVWEDTDFGGIQQLIIANDKNKTNLPEDFINHFYLKHPHIKLKWLPEVLEGIDEEHPIIPRGKNEILYLVHSSGTTGFPKSVILKNGPQSHAVRGWMCYVHISRTFDKGYLAVPNNHQAVILSFNSLLLLGLRCHWTSAYDHEDFNAEKVIDELANEKYTGFFGFPITYTQMKEVKLENYDLKRMRFWATTADASHEVIIRHFVRAGSTFKSLGLPVSGSVFLDAQGSSEVGTPSVIRYVTTRAKKFNRRIGRPGSTPYGPHIRITKNGEHVKNGDVGRLEVKGKTLFAGYYNNPALTKSSFNYGWFFTGDVARINEDGHIIQLDREVDVVHTNHGDVYTLPIEEKIHKHPAVFDACVYGEYQTDGSQLPSIAVALRRGFNINENQLLTELNNLLEKDQQLNLCEIMPWKHFPIGITGKTLKRIFRERSVAKITNLLMHTNLQSN